MIKNILKTFYFSLPLSVRYDLPVAFRKVQHKGSNRYCPVCENEIQKFYPGGQHHIRSEARCPICNSYERHRLVALFFRDWTNLYEDNLRLLHIAPTLMFEARFSKMANLTYLTADLFRPNVMEKMDITDIKHPDSSFDVIYCSHVLEHVPDDLKAMQEFKRVLSDEGWAILQVPITSEATYEDFSITDPQDRLEHFGQEDHVRRYGLDYGERLRKAGLKVLEIPTTVLFDSEKIKQMGLDSDERVYFTAKNENEIFNMIKNKLELVLAD